MRRALLGAVLALTACSPSVDPPMTRSCRGEDVDECDPYTYAAVTAAALTPAGITLNDATMRAHVHVEFSRCAMASSMPLTVQITAFIGGTSDASFSDPDDSGTTDARVIPLTTIGPADSGATSMDVDIDNPFFANVPENTQLQLQFAPVIDGCEGDLFSQPYRTGPEMMEP